METTLSLAGLAGFLVPLVLAAIMRADWPDWKRSLVAYGAYLGLGLLTAWGTGQFTGLGITASVGVVLTVAATSFKTFWNKVGATDRLESLTNGGQRHQ